MFLLIVCLALFPVLPGMCTLTILYGRTQKRMQPGDVYIVGWLLCMSVAGLTNVLAVLAGQSLLACTKIFVSLLAALELLSAVLLFICRKIYGARQEACGIKKPQNMGQEGNRKQGNGKEVLIYLFFGVLVLLQILYMCHNRYVYMAGDMTLETVQSFLDTNALYSINPLTGQAYQAGVPLRIRILCLPTLYAMLCSIFDIPAQLLVWTIMPVYHLLCGYVVYSLLSRQLFPDKPLYRGCFLVLVALLLSQGTYAYGMDGLGMLYRGFRGEAVRAVILLPYVVRLVLEKKRLFSRLFMICLCVFAEACMVWTLYGLGACLLLAAGLLVTLYWGQKSGLAEGLQQLQNGKKETKLKKKKKPEKTGKSEKDKKNKNEYNENKEESGSCGK